MFALKTLTFSITQVALLASLAAPGWAGNDKPKVTYLALGDSVPFGMNILLVLPGQPTPSPSQFKGYPEVVADIDHLAQSQKAEMNASCPGETSASFLNQNVTDNGCNSQHVFPNGTKVPPIKPNRGLHTNYPGVSQMEFAIQQLSSNKQIKLVTLSIGANDLLLLQLQAIGICGPDPVCINKTINDGLPAALGQFAANLSAILGGIRQVYDGKLVLVTYYAPSNDTAQIAVTQALNGVMAQVGSGFKAMIADGYGAFQAASQHFGGDPCAAGLLIPLPEALWPLLGKCDVHPSLIGQTVLANVVDAAHGNP